ncbi:hypothetical protein BDW02DRAFT_322455 [Decorospora gaudefroyi]|uniref:Uncharacterized protein n=1 Tax=Decorospora gaudefroyi TaxID=184978 RepID=A0A6A5KF00_9PLEO|nr:hypothetical protein BDW02DRAFT_322455 [Decorospora gaudefroyi]
MASTTSFGDRNYGIQGGIFNGPVSAAFHQPPERRETPPPPSIVIPFGRDKDFVERGTILGNIKKRCAAPDSRTALVGLGGVGRSSLSSMPTARTSSRPRRGCSGCMLATPPGSSRASAT